MTREIHARRERVSVHVASGAATAASPKSINSKLAGTGPLAVTTRAPVSLKGIKVLSCATGNGEKRMGSSLTAIAGSIPLKEVVLPGSYQPIGLPLTVLMLPSNPG